MTTASKVIYGLLHPALMLSLICVNDCWSYQSCLGQLGFHFIVVPSILLRIHSIYTLTLLKED